MPRCRLAAGPLLVIALWRSLPALAVAALWIGFHALLGWFGLPRQAAGAEDAARSLR